MSKAKVQHPTKSTTHDEKFFHFPVSPDEVESSGASHITVFAREEAVGTNMWRFSAAVCSNKDQFCRRSGRNVARRKYFRNVNIREAKPIFVDQDQPNSVTLLTEAFRFAQTQLLNYALSRRNR